MKTIPKPKYDLNQSMISTTRYESRCCFSESFSFCIFSSCQENLVNCS